MEKTKERNVKQQQVKPECKIDSCERKRRIKRRIDRYHQKKNEHDKINPEFARKHACAHCTVNGPGFTNNQKQTNKGQKDRRTDGSSEFSQPVPSIFQNFATGLTGYLNSL